MKLKTDKKHAQIVSRIAELEKKLAERKQELREHEERLYANQGVVVGTVVVDRCGHEYKLTEIPEYSKWGRAFAKGNPKKQNGEFGKSVRNFYDWELKK